MHLREPSAGKPSTPSYKPSVELQALGSVTEMAFLGCIEILVTDMRRDTYIHAHKDFKRHKEACWMTCWIYTSNTPP